MISKDGIGMIKRWQESLMAEWLGWVSEGYEMYCHDLEVIGSNPG